MSKQDRQGVRTPADIERKYDLGGMASDADKIKSINREVSQLKADIESLIDAIESMSTNAYPVGSIYVGVTSVNPSTLFGGTWESVGEGYLMIGLDQESEDQTEVKFLDSCYIWKRTS